MHELVAAILVSDGQVLLGDLSPSRSWYHDVWDTPVSHVRPGEQPNAALRRELAEELGIEVGPDIGQPIAHVVDTRGQDGGLAIRIWRIGAWHGSVTDLATDEHNELRWSRRQEVPYLPLTHPALGPQLAETPTHGVTCPSRC